MKLVSKCGKMFIDIPEDLDYGNADVKNMVEDLQKALDNISESGYFLYPSDLGNLSFNEETEELWKLEPRDSFEGVPQISIPEELLHKFKTESNIEVLDELRKGLE